MPHGVHPSVKGVEPARLDPVLDRPRPKPERHQLPSSDYPVLPLRKAADHLVDAQAGRFYPL